MRVSRFSLAGLIVSFMLLSFCAVGVRAAARPPVLLVVGDSLSAAYKIPVAKGWVHLLSERLKRRGYDYRVVNASIPGDATAGGLSRLPDELSRSDPAIVVIELGGNDGLQGLPLSQMQDNLARMVTLARQAGAKVLLVGVRMPPNYGAAYTKRFAAVYLKVAAAKDVPLVPELMKGVVAHPALMQERGIHPRAAAEPKLLYNVWPALEPLLAQPKDPPGANRNKNFYTIADIFKEPGLTGYAPESLEWSPDGKCLSFLLRAGARGEASLYTVDTETGKRSISRV